MLDDDHRIAQIAQFFQHGDQPVRIARMQTDTRFVEDIQRSYQTAAKRSSQIDPLALAAGQRRRQPVEGQVAETDLIEVFEPVADFGQHPRSGFPVAVVEPQTVEKTLQFVDRHRHQLADMLSANLHVERLLTQPPAAAVGTNGLAGIARKHHPVLDLVTFSLQEFEKFVESVEKLIAFP